MQPASSSGEGPKSSRSLRKWGPVAALVAVAAVVAIVVISSGGGDESESGGGDTSAPDESVVATDTPSTIAADDWEYPLSLAEATEAGIADTIDWGTRCDIERGALAVPDFFAPDCYAPFDGDNGGATEQGVTADEITLVHYMGPDGDPIINYITDAVKVDDTNAQEKESIEGYIEYFQTYYEFYGRTINYVVYESTGLANDEVSARADAQAIVEKYQPFAVIGGPALTNAFADEMAAQGVLCISCGATGSTEWLVERDPYIWALDGSAEQKQILVAEYIGKQLAGRPASHAGDALKDTTRKFALVYVESGSESKRLADLMSDRLAEVGAEPALLLPYVLDPGTIQQSANQIVAKMKAEGITSVILATDPVAPRDFTREATAQEYEPEWIIPAATLVDVTAFGRSYDQTQWAHAFGVSSLSARRNPETSGSYYTYKWFTGVEPPADDSTGVYTPPFFLFAAALQEAGPNLSHESISAAIRTFETQKAITQPWLTWGDHGIWDDDDHHGIDDATLVWWDPDATGADEIRREGSGMYMYVDGGLRYLPGEFGDEDKMFVADGAVGIYDSPPAEETPPDYPSPAG